MLKTHVKLELIFCNERQLCYSSILHLSVGTPFYSNVLFAYSTVIIPFSFLSYELKITNKFFNDFVSYFDYSLRPHFSLSGDYWSYYGDYDPLAAI
jgi:hypothetical protein